ncbi:MAG: trypsin-like peptidase domain-containing protein [Caldilineales bacterium]
MNSQNRKPLIGFALLFGLLFLCLCLLGTALIAARLADDGRNALSQPNAGFDFTMPQASPADNGENQSAPAATPAAVAPIIIDPGADVEPQILRAVYQKANPSVVKIISMGVVSTGTSDQDLPQGQGSGFVWDTTGLIVTNAHVVDGASGVQVIFADDRSVTGEVLGADPFSDLAVIQIDPTGFDLVALERGNIDDLQVGDRAIAIGAPFDFAGSMTVGTVSGLGRSISSLDARYTIPEVIQTDAPINPGNSGGPLLDAQARVIGINAQIRSDGDVRANSGVGFAIPITIAERVVPALVATGEYQHPFLGIMGQTFSPEWAEALSFPLDARGAYVTQAVQGGPAARAGITGADRDTTVIMGVNSLTGEAIYLQAGGDLIVGINDKPVQRFDDLLIYLFRYASPGDTVQLKVIHADGKQETVPVTLAVRPAQ